MKRKVLTSMTAILIAGFCIASLSLNAVLLHQSRTLKHQLQSLHQEVDALKELKSAAAIASTELPAAVQNEDYADAKIITRITDKGYTYQHGDHEHFVKGFPWPPVRFLSDLVLPSGTAVDQVTTVAKFDGYDIVKVDEGYKVLIRDEKIRPLLTVSKTEARRAAQRKMTLKQDGHSHDHEDDFVFDMKQVVSTTEDGYVVRHGDHYHFVPFDQVPDGKRPSVPNSPKPDVRKPAQPKNPEDANDQHLKHGSDHLNASDLAVVRAFAKDKGLRLLEIKVNGDLVIWPHGDHSHVEFLPELRKIYGISQPDVPVNPVKPTPPKDGGKPDTPKPVSPKKPDQANDDHLKPGSDQLNASDLAIVRALAKDKGLRLSEIKVNGDLVIWPHGDHHHVESLAELRKRYGKQDPSDGRKPDSPKPPVEPEKPTPSESTELAPGSDKPTADQLRKIRYIADLLKLSLNEIKLKDGSAYFVHPGNKREMVVGLRTFILFEDFPQTDEVTSQGLKGTSDQLSPQDLKKAQKVAQQVGLPLSEIWVKDGVAAWAHHDHVHAVALENINLPPDDFQFPNTDEVTEQGVKKGSDHLDEQDLKRAKWAAKALQLKLSDLYVRNGVIYWEDGDEIKDFALNKITLEEGYDPDQPAPDPNETNQPTNQGLKAGSDHLSEADLLKVQYLAAQQHLKLSDITVTKGYVIWPHGDHQHTIELSKIQVPEGWQPGGSTEDAQPPTEQGLMHGSDTATEDQLKRLDYLAESLGLKRSDIMFSDGTAYWVDNGHWRKKAVQYIYLPSEFPDTTAVNDQGLLEGSIKLDSVYLARAQFVAKTLGVELSKIWAHDGHLLSWKRSSDGSIQTYPIQSLVLKEELTLSSEGNDQGVMQGSDQLSEPAKQAAEQVAKLAGCELKDVLAKDHKFYYPSRERTHYYFVTYADMQVPEDGATSETEKEEKPIETSDEHGTPEAESGEEKPAVDMEAYQNKLDTVDVLISHLKEAAYPEQIQQFKAESARLRSEVDQAALDQLEANIYRFVEDHPDALE